VLLAGRLLIVAAVHRQAYTTYTHINTEFRISHFALLLLVLFTSKYNQPIIIITFSISKRVARLSAAGEHRAC
jgi:hypothetical protein